MEPSCDEAYLRRQQVWVEQFNSTRWENTDGGEECALCGNKRLQAFLKGAYVTMRPCRCGALMRYEEQLQRSGLRPLALRCGFENYRAEAPWQKALLQKARACAKTENWLLLCGQSGSGKTHLAAALALQLLEAGRQVLFMSWPEECNRLIAAWFDYGRREALLEPFLKAEVLLLDDLFKTRRDKNGLPEVGRQEQDAAFELVERRSREGRRTLITTEVLTGALRALNEGLFGRIKERTGPFVADIAYSEARNWRLTAS